MPCCPCLRAPVVCLFWQSVRTFFLSILFASGFISACLFFCTDCYQLHSPSPCSITDKLQRLLNAAARVITGTRKFDRGLTHILHNELHWQDVPQRVIFKLCTTVYKCLHGLAPQYLAELCVAVADVPGRRHLRSASRGLLDYPLYNLSNYCMADVHFRMTALTTGTLFPYNLPNSVSITSFKRALKTFLFR